MDLPLPQEITRMDGERLRRYRENLDFYHGKQWTGQPRRRERRLTFNYARAVTDKVTSYLMSGLDLAVDPPEPTPEGEALARRTEAALRRVHEENNLDQLDFETELDAAILGDAAYKVTWDVETARVRVSAPDVQGLFVWCRGDDPTRVRRVASRYQVSAAEARALFDLTAPERTHAAVPSTRAQGVSVVEGWTDQEFELWLDGHLHTRVPNPYGVIPFVIYPNVREAKAFWGVSDIAAIVEPARELNRALSQLSLILEMSGNPIAVLENVTESAGIAVAPGAVWELPPDAKAYLLDLLQGGGVRLHAEYIDLVYRTLHDLGESPRTAFGENQQGLSGVALNTELDPLLKKVQRKRLIRSAAYRRRAELILRIRERFTGESYAPYRTRVLWGPVLPQDRSRQVADERVLVAAGIHSRRRAADALGVEDPEAEFQRWLEEAAQVRTLSAAPRASNGAIKVADMRNDGTV
jgi:hypothetical protein